MTDITRKRGDTYADELIIKSKATKKPIDITGWTFVLTVDPNQGPLDASSNVYQVHGVVLDGPAGRVEFAPTDVQADQVGAFYFDVQALDTAGRKRTIFAGRYTYKQDISKD